MKVALVCLFGISVTQTQGPELWKQGCLETSIPQTTKTCGTRTSSGPVSGLGPGTASPGEFPWACLLLNQNNDILGNCAVIPNDSRNDNSQGTSKVITAAHKLKVIGETDLLKVRVGEWDTSSKESKEHLEYTVVRICKHTQFDPRRLSNDIAILTLNRKIDLSDPNINTACLPSCREQFDHKFDNGTGVRCWVAGWEKDKFNGDFKFLQQMVDLPLVPNNECERRLKKAYNRREDGSGDGFRLDRSEICAGEVRKDACTGGGGSPLVCQATSGRWTVVGLVTWGIGCNSEVPGVYVRVSHFKGWIDTTSDSTPKQGQCM